MTTTAKAKVPVFAGVPLIKPLDEDSVSPFGSDPEVSAQRYGPVPPIAASVNVYATPTTPLGRVVGVVMPRLDETLIVNCLVADAEPLSITCTVKGKVPDAEGAPAMMPFDAFSDRPAGSDPCVTDQWYGAAPPAASSCCE